jgi:hypothetical protein
MTRRLLLGVLLAVVALLLAACEVEEEAEEAEVTPTPDARAELERLRLEEEAKPRFEGVVNGIRLYPTGSASPPERTWACSDAKPEEIQHVDMSAVAGTAMEIVPSYLPPGAEETSSALPPVICKGTVAYVQRDWNMPGDGLFFIARREGQRVIDIDASAERVSPTTIGGKPAVLVAPLAADGYGPSAAIVAEEFGLTVVSAVDLPLKETVKIAEGLE